MDTGSATAPSTLKKKADKVVARDKGICDIHVIAIYLTITHSNTWVFDTGSIAHICNSQQDLKSKRRLERNKLTIRVGNSQHVDIVAISALRLPYGYILVLNKCYYIPALSMSIVSGCRLSRDGYYFESITTGCSIFKDNIFYVHAPNRDGLYILDLYCNETHINSVDANRCNLSDDIIPRTCGIVGVIPRLGHVGIKHMKKLHSDGLLGSLDFVFFDTREPCLMGKMTRAPFTRFVERATDLLGIIHADVCGPMSVFTRNGYC
jgi:hypothetical protein